MITTNGVEEYLELTLFNNFMQQFQGVQRQDLFS